MARAIEYELAAIRNARYGADVRDAIHNSIERCYDDVQAGVTVAEGVANRANTVISDAESAANRAATIASNASTTLNEHITNFDTTVNQKITSYDATISGKVSDVDGYLSTLSARVTSAEEATTRAGNAANVIETLTVSYENVGPNESGSATYRTMADGHRDILFRLRQGAKGESNVVKGDAFATLEALQAGVPNPNVGDMYNVGSSAPYTIYRWTGTTWENQGQIGINISDVSTTDIDTMWDGGTASGNKAYLERTGLSHFIRKILSALNSKVSTDGSKGLSTNDYTDAEKTKLAGIAAGAQVNVQPDWNAAAGTAGAILNKPTIPAGVVVDSTLSDTSTNAIQNKAVKAAIDSAIARHLTVTPVSAFTPSWVASGDTAYPYYTDITVAGIDDNWFVDVVFSLADASSGVFAPVCESLSTGKVRIWAINNTVTSITIKTISAWR